ncbi:colanic acid/biofilm transcriptional regulator [compost metagenome]
MELRALLEAHATFDACSFIDSEGLEEIRTYSCGLTRASNENDMNSYLDFNQKLKFGIFNYCSSETLRAHIELLWLQCGPFLRHLSIDPGMAPPTFCVDAVTALAAGDAAAASVAISEDVKSGMEYLLAHGQFDDDNSEPKGAL